MTPEEQWMINEIEYLQKSSCDAQSDLESGRSSWRRRSSMALMPTTMGWCIAMNIRFKDAVKAMREHGKAIPEYARLQILDQCWRIDDRTRRYLEKRRSWHRAIRELAENGKLAVVWQGLRLRLLQRVGYHRRRQLESDPGAHRSYVCLG